MKSPLASAAYYTHVAKSKREPLAQLYRVDEYLKRTRSMDPITDSHFADCYEVISSAVFAVIWDGR